jgi:hypothetical protein
VLRTTILDPFNRQLCYDLYWKDTETLEEGHGT